MSSQELPVGQGEGREAAQDAEERVGVLLAHRGGEAAPRCRLVQAASVW